MRCGHDEPSKEETSYLAKSPFLLTESYILTLKSNDIAIIDMNGKIFNGTWTMVYDEGFEIKFNDFSFFSFSKYIIDEENGKKSYKSQCYLTCVGWYRQIEKENWGCFEAEKSGVDSKKITYFNTKNSLNIVEPTDALLSQMNNSEENNIINSVMNMQFKSIRDEITFGDKINRNKLRKNKMRNQSSFLEEQSFSMLKLDSSFNKHTLYISKINTLKKSWNAALDPNFSNLSIRQLNKIAGIPRSKIDTQPKQKVESNKNFKEDVSMFPTNFDWKDKLKPAGNQGNCGSCYVYSTIRMLQARLKIKYNHDVDLSVQHALDCSFFNQGCSGGYPYLVMKFASEFELVPEVCKPYTVNILFIIGR
jgi:cathepsin C